jgi:uncharacterized protein
MLWKFYKNDPDVCHYLFGTMHLATDEAYTYISLAKKYILKSAIYAAEMDLNASFGQDMTPYFLMEDGLRIQDFFRPKQYLKACKIIRKVYNIELSQYDHFSPFFITNLLSELSIDKTQNTALDHHLWQFAIASNKEMYGVESFADQVRILKQIPLDYQVKSFKDTVKNLPLLRKKISHLNKLYAQGNYDQLYKSSHKSMGKIRKLMIYDRNLMMRDRIISLSSLKTCFFAIGAAHFPGGKGILALLKKEGYTIKLIVPE